MQNNILRLHALDGVDVNTISSNTLELVLNRPVATYPTDIEYSLDRDEAKLQIDVILLTAATHHAPLWVKYARFQKCRQHDFYLSKRTIL